jgi:ubiquinone/menaquinone biosynthesis C-methylase UbiE
MADNGKDGEIDTSAAEAFEKYLVPTIFGPWSEAMIDHARTEENHRLLDVGCGSGAAARYAAQIVGTGGSVSAIDFNAGMIAHARTLDPNRRIDWQQGDVTDMPYNDGAFDIVAGNQLLQFLPDKEKGLSEMKRVLTDKGRLALTVYCAPHRNPAHAAVATSLEKHGIDAKGVVHPFSFGDPVMLGDLLQDAGFKDVSVVRKQMDSYFPSAENFIECLAAGGPSSRHALEQLDADGLKSLKAEVTETLAEFVDPKKGLRVITAANMALARA